MRGRIDNAGSRGFSLLEVMVALAILATTLVVLLQIITNNVRATNHAKMTTAATLLARAKMTDIEDSVLENGFSTDNEADKGTFRDQNFPNFRWESSIERIELPTDMKQAAQDQASDSSKSKDPMSALTGMMGGLMGSFLDPIRIGLQESVRRVTVKVIWDETARPNQTLEVVTFLTDPAKLDQSLTGTLPGGPAAAGGTPGGLPGGHGTFNLGGRKP